MADCIFCKIIAGDIPSAKIYEDDNVIAFLDIAPCSFGHTLVVPKKHFVRIDQCDSETATAIGKVLTKVASAIVKALDIENYNVLNNNGPISGQEVPHVHFHIIPCTDGKRFVKFGPQSKYPPDQMDITRQGIIDAL